MRIESAEDNRNGFFYEASSLHLRNVPAAFTPSVEWSKGGLYPDPGDTPEPPQILSPSLPDQVKIEKYPHYRGLHSSPVLASYRKQLATQEGTNEFLSSLTETQRIHLGVALVREEEKRNGMTEVVPPSWKQLRLLCYQNMLPFIGFGFLDNFIMITVADRIQETIGVAFCLTTMAAAGMGNMVSDLAGLGLADRVDALCRSLGIPDPKLTSSQLSLTVSRWMSLLGRCVGIIVGCFLGMCPLLWIHTHERDHAPQSKSNQDQ